MRLYRCSEDGREFLGVAETTINGYVFETYIDSEENARDVEILYEIDER